MSSKSMHREFKEVIQSYRTKEGGGFTVRRPFPTSRYQQIDPFLLLDEMGPVDYSPGEAKGAPDHPHRGFETVSYVISGEMEHSDSTGHSGKLGPGCVQWMTAGSGIVHREMPSSNIMKVGGRVHGFQIWINLPSAYKMIDPFYQEYSESKLPKVELISESGASSSVVVVSGKAHGVESPVRTKIPCVYLHYKIAPGSHVEWSIPTEWTPSEISEFTLFGYVFKNSVVFGDFNSNSAETPEIHDKFLLGDALSSKLGSSTKFFRVGEGQLILFSRTHPEAFAAGVNSSIKITNTGDDDAEVLILGAQPLNEPMVRQGPFVMNTRKEIEQAFQDFYSGKMGKIKGV
ncbi:hypothetical protein HK096_006305, partial [Nowakowskiella sp. JEL0078]